jgi:hypothetical protein
MRKPPVRSGRNLERAAKAKYSRMRERIECMTEPSLIETSLDGLSGLTKMGTALDFKSRHA